MRITLGVDFEPMNEEWESYCTHALRTLRQNKDCGAQLGFHEESSMFYITGIPGVDQPAWFKLAPGGSFHHDHILQGWVMMVGDSAVIRPVVEVKRKWVEKVAQEHLVLKAQVEGTPAEVGLYRILSGILYSAKDLNDGDIALLKSVNDTVRARRRAEQPDSPASKRADAQYAKEYPNGPLTGHE